MVGTKINWRKRDYKSVNKFVPSAYHCKKFAVGWQLSDGKD